MAGLGTWTEGPVHIDWFGAIPNDKTAGAANVAAFNAAFNFRPTPGKNAAPKILLGHGDYYTNATLEPLEQVHIEGEGAGWTVLPLGSGSGTYQNQSRIISPVDVTTFRVRLKSTGDSGITSDPLYGRAQGTILRNLVLTQATLGSSITAHGLDVRGTVLCENVYVRYAAGNGFNIVGDTSGVGPVRYGTPDHCMLIHCYVHEANKHGFYIRGNEANAGSTFKCHVHQAAGCGFFDRSNLGNSHHGPSINDAGNNGVVHGGNRYVLLGEDPVVAAATTPGTNANIWLPLGPGATSSRYFTWNAADTTQHEFPKLPFLLLCQGGSVHGGYMEMVTVPSHGVGPFFGGTWLLTQQTASGRAAGSTGRGALYSNSGVGFYHTGGEASVDAGTYSYTLIGTPDVQLQDNTKRRNILEHRNQADGEVSLGWGWHLGDMYLRYKNNTAYWNMSGKVTTQQFGTGAVQPYHIHFQNLVIGSSFTNARRLTNGTVAPTTGAHGVGEIVFNRTPASGKPMGWMCTVAGTPGTWLPMGNL